MRVLLKFESAAIQERIILHMKIKYRYSNKKHELSSFS